MALDPKNAVHAGQIAAGATGRRRGHAFEHALSVQISAVKLPIPPVDTLPNKHLVVGEPATELIRYVLDHEDLSDVTIVASYWLGGLATSGEGDHLRSPDGTRIRGSKSDIVVLFRHRGGERYVGVSVKTCFNRTPTNAQLYCTTASAFCELLRDNGIVVSSVAENGLRMYCGDTGFRPMDDPQDVAGRVATPERWFWEELPGPARSEWESLLQERHRDVLRILLQKAYPNDPYPPEFVLHVRHRAATPTDVPLALYAIEELVELSCQYCGFMTREYQVRKGRFKDDPDTHLAPRFGIVQFQPMGNKQNRSQLQFNLQANYFGKLPCQGQPPHNEESPS